MAVFARSHRPLRKMCRAGGSRPVCSGRAPRTGSEPTSSAVTFLPVWYTERDIPSSLAWRRVSWLWWQERSWEPAPAISAACGQRDLPNHRRFHVRTANPAFPGCCGSPRNQHEKSDHRNHDLLYSRKRPADPFRGAHRSGSGLCGGGPVLRRFQRADHFPVCAPTAMGPIIVNTTRQL